MLEGLVLSKNKIREVLRSKGITLTRIIAEPAVFDMACKYTYKSLPIPLRWFVGKKRVERLVRKVTEQASNRISAAEVGAKKAAGNS